jgi:hypothetical protein
MNDSIVLDPLLGGSLERCGGMACGEIPPIELGRGRKKGGWSDIPGPVLIATLHYAAVLPTKFSARSTKKFGRWRKNSAPHKITHKRSISLFFH